jgi:hypothetical protein
LAPFFATSSNKEFEALPDNPGLFKLAQCSENKPLLINLTGAVSFLASIDLEFTADFAKKI